VITLNAALLTDGFRTHEVLLSATYFEFHCPHFVSFYSMGTSTEVTSDSTLRNLRQRGTSQQRVNANEWRTRALPGPCRFMWGRLWLWGSRVRKETRGV